MRTPFPPLRTRRSNPRQQEVQRLHDLVVAVGERGDFGAQFAGFDRRGVLGHHHVGLAADVERGVEVARRKRRVRRREQGHREAGFEAGQQVGLAIEQQACPRPVPIDVETGHQNLPIRTCGASPAAGRAP